MEVMKVDRKLVKVCLDILRYVIVAVLGYIAS